ncbi:MAG: 50S ribosomal protein L15 [bacterium]
MNLHSLKNTAGARTTRKRLGRGMSSGLGKTSGRGHKGQYARSGHKHKLGFEGGQMRLIRRIPKRGFTNISRKEYLPVNVGMLSMFDAGTEVTPELMRASGLANGVADGIKILGNGNLSKKLVVKANAFSAGAKSKIEGAGGICEIVT